jgi:hypothetical protein
MVEIDRFMAAGRRRWWSIHLLRWACQGIVAGGAAGVAAYLAGGGPSVALGLTVGGVCLVPLARWRQRLDPPALAHLLDRAAGLGSTLTAAAEFRHRDDPWCTAQRRYTTRLLAGLDPAILLPWRGTGWAVAAGATLFAVTLLPSGLPTMWGRASGMLPEQIAPLNSPLPGLTRGGREGPPSLRERQKGRASGDRNAPGTAQKDIASATARTPAPPKGASDIPPSLWEGKGERTYGPGSTPGAHAEQVASAAASARRPQENESGAGHAVGAHTSGDIGTAPAATPLLGEPKRSVPQPSGPATLSLGGSTPPGRIAAPAGPVGATPPAPGPRATSAVRPAPPEAVPMYMHPVVARYFDLLHLSRQGDAP